MRPVSLMLASLFLFAARYSLAQDIEERFGTFLIEKADVSKRFSVFVERVIISERADPKGSVGVGTTRILQRFMMGNHGAWQRIDGINFNLMSPSDLSGQPREAQLVHENQGWYFSFYPRTPKEKISRFQVKAGIVNFRPTDSRRKHPFDIASTNYGAFLGEGYAGIASLSPKLVDEVVLKDGRTRMTMFMPNGFVYVVTFNKEYTWCIEEIEFQLKENHDFDPNAPPLRSLTKEMLKEYRTFATNQTKWEDVAGHRVPIRTIITQQNGKTSRDEMEARFLDWKFGDDVDEELLDDIHFTPEKIRKAMDFDKLRQRFDDLR
jgi:hypothetical protein